MPRAKARAERRPSRTIPAALHAAVVARLGEVDPATSKPYTSRAVAAWLQAEHRITCSHMAVLRARAAVDARGEAMLVAALREQLRDAVAPALVRLKRATKRLDTLARQSKSVKDLAAATNAMTRSLHEIAHLGGVAAPLKIDLTSGGDPLDAAVARFAASLARAGVQDDAGAAAGAAGDAPEGDRGDAGV